MEGPVCEWTALVASLVGRIIVVGWNLLGRNVFVVIEF